MKVDKNNDYCHLKLPKDFDKILKFNYGQKSVKMPFVIYADLCSNETVVTREIDTCENNSEWSFSAKVNKKNKLTL